MLAWSLKMVNIRNIYRNIHVAKDMVHHWKQFARFCTPILRVTDVVRHDLSAGSGCHHSGASWSVFIFHRGSSLVDIGFCTFPLNCNGGSINFHIEIISCGSSSTVQFDQKNIKQMKYLHVPTSHHLSTCSNGRELLYSVLSLAIVGQAPVL